MEQAGWTWEVPEDVSFVDTVPVPVGVLVVLSDGFVALAGDTGEELWEYRAGENAHSAYASHLGDYLALEVDIADEGPSLIELDPSSGEVVSKILVDGSDSGSGIDKRSFIRDISDGVMLRIDYIDFPVLGISSLETGNVLWAKEERPECTSIDGSKVEFNGGLLLGRIALQGFSCSGDENGGALVGMDISTGEEIWRFEEEFDPALTTPDRLYDPISDRHVVMRRIGGPNVLFDVVAGESLGSWEEAVIGVLADGSVVLLDSDEDEYRLEDPSGALVDMKPIPRGTARSVYPVALEGGVVDYGEPSASEEVAWRFHPWRTDKDPLLIDTSILDLEGEKRIVTSRAVPGAAVVGYTEKEGDGRTVLVGLTPLQNGE